MPRTRQHTDNATKQAAYRERKKEQMLAGSKGYSDKELGQKMRDLHIQMKAAATGGNIQCQDLIGETPAETLRNIERLIVPPFEWKPL